MNKTRNYIRILLLVLLLVGGGTGNDAWAAKVRYHILTLPFSIRNYDNSGFYKEEIRVEALLVINDAPIIELPEQYKSPLATNFQYWKSWGTPEYTYLFDRDKNPHVLEVKYNIYSGTHTEDANKIAVGADASAYTDVYVTYDYDVNGEAKTREIFLDRGQDYNITVGGDKFLCYNRSRNNRIANANTGALTGEDLVSEDFVVAPAGTGKNQLGFNWSTDQFAGAHGVHMGFWLAPTPYEFDPEPDPYNITLMTAYVGNETYQKDPVENQYFVKPYKGATLFSLISSNANGKGTETKMWFDCDNDKHYKGVPGSDGINDPASDNYWDKQVDYWPGYFRHTNQPLFNSVALLNHPSGNGYVFVGSKFNQGVGSGSYKEWAPNSSGNYATLTNDNNNPFMSFKTLASSPVINIYKIRKYILKLKTHGSETELAVRMRWSDAKASDKIVDHLPDDFKRKYCSYKAYIDEGLTKEVTTFADVKSKIDAKEISEDQSGNIVLWFDYTVTESFPFETLPKDGSYVNARWYTMRMNGKAEQKNIAYNSSDNLITGSSSIGSESDLHYGETCENSSNAMVAFIGDPYELKIISRAASETAGANRYIGCITGAEDNTPLNTNKEDISGNIITWEIVYENTDMGNFVLRQFNTYDNPRYIGWNTGETNHPVVYSYDEPTNNNRIRVVELEKVKYTYYIVRNNEGNIAVKASSSHDVGKMLSSWEDIPEVIRSSLHIATTPTATYYESIDDAQSNSNPITSAPYDSKRDIYVRYSFSPSPGSGIFNVILNGEYLYTDGDVVRSKGTITGDDAANSNYQWTMDYSDPYAMTIQNMGNGKYVKFSSWNDNTAITWVNTAEEASHFVAKGRAYARTYEVMAATGKDIDASETYYNIGRPTDNTVMLYSNNSYLSGNATLLFQFISTLATDVTYHLIDKAGKDLLQAKTRQVSDDKPTFPPEFHSPLVKTYHYYLESNFDEKGTGADITYTLKVSQTEATIVSADIYVTYDVNDLVDLKSGQLYLLKYEAGEYFRQEDGSNGLLREMAEFQGTEEEKTARYKAVYPYVNGDGNFFVYGENERELQQAAASTRTRWVWYVQSDLGTKGDPYHVTIKSFQEEPFPYINYKYYNAYFKTYRPAGYSEVVTTLAWPGMSEETATEYMVLGSEGQYQLVTTYPVDENGNNKVDLEEKRYVVDSFEQYWKTYDTIKKILLKDQLDDCAKEDKTDDPEGSFTVPTEPTLLRTTLTGTGTNEYGFHSYEKWAYAKRWNGYNNGYSTTTGTPDNKKGWETIEHWYQTVDMGEGYFDFVKTSVDPVLILLDQHGWEIMRKPLPSSPDDPDKELKYEAIRPYDSPMVKEYKFYSDATKATGYHKYIPTTMITVDGEQYVSTSLASLPPYETAVNVKDKKGNLNDQYVTYTVKDEYAQAYSCTYSAGVASERPKPFLIQQGNYFVYESDGKIKTAVPAGGMNQYITDNIGKLTESGEKKNELWYIRPNRSIETEMGMSYGTVTDITKKEPWTQDVTETYYETNHLNGFDPYNIQIQSVSSNTKYLVTNATGAIVVDGSMEATYEEDSPTISLGTQVIVSGAGTDNTTLRMTNATFMAVQDENGNMQLMPRFDHSHRMSDFSTLTAPTDVTTYTKLYRPVVYDYRIIDNAGHESLRYQSGGDLLPQTPDHFKSPLAKNFKYYASATESSGTYSNIEDEITESLDGANLEDDIVYIRYEYDEDADNLNILKGNWLTMQLDNKTAQYTTVGSTPGIYSSLTTYSLTANNSDDLDSQAKKLTATGNYYFKVGDDYYEVTVNSIVPEELGSYSAVESGSSSAWDALSFDSPYKLTATNNDDLDYKARRLTDTENLYYFKVATSDPNTYNYKTVTVKKAYIESHAAYTSSKGTFSSQWNNSKPLVVNAGGKKWQWKFLRNQQSTPDPYAVYLFNRNEKDQELPDVGSRFAILSHSSDDYALAQAGTGDYSYKFLNGSKMTTSDHASIDEDKDGEKPSGFTSTSGVFHGTDSQVKLTDEVQHTLTYKVYTNTGELAIEADQTLYDLTNNNWKPVLPESARTPLLDIDQYRYYEQDLTGTILESDTIDKALPLLYGIYDDIIYTHYTPYSVEKTDYLVPNVRNATNVDPVARDSESNDAPLGLNGTRLYNIIWYQDNMMKSNGDNIACEADKELQNTAEYEWVLEGEDPYAIKIKSVKANKYVSESTTTPNTCNLNTTASNKVISFMLLNREGYDYGVLAKTGDKNTMLSWQDELLTNNNPTHFIIFALSTFKVIYHLIIANINSSKSIPYAELENGNRVAKPDKVIPGSTYRDLESREITGEGGEEGHTPGDKYQLGVTLRSLGVNKTGSIFDNPSNADSIYCDNGGRVSLGDELEVPSVFYRPNVNYDFYIGGIYAKDGTEGTGTDAEDIVALNNKYKGLKVTNLGEDSKLLDKIVFVNIVYNFMGGLDTNSGSDFVADVSQNMWYTFETSNDTPMLAEYTGTLQTKSGRATHYTNDYLWTPVGDPYGFKMYNRYACKNLLKTGEVMSTSVIGQSQDIEMVDESSGATTDDAKANAVYELLTTNATTPGYFIVHPVVNKTGLQYYMNNNSSTGDITLSRTPTEWTFGLSEDVMRPYYEAAGYVGGLNAAGKAKYEEKAAIEDQFNRLIALQDVVYNYDKADNDAYNYIVHYAPGYYRLHSQPGSSGITTPRYASGYTHKIELTEKDKDNNTAIPMHFYEVPEYTFLNPSFSDLLPTSNSIVANYYTETAATRGDIPLSTVTCDPASIFKFTGETPASVTMSTQGLYVNQNKMDESIHTSYEIIDIGGGVIALQNGTSLLNYNQNSTIYDLKFNTATELNEADALESTRWCMQPVQKKKDPGDGEMGLQVATNDDGKGNYLTTFCAPFDVLLTKEEDEAFVLPPAPEGGWPTITPPATTAVIHPQKIGKFNTGDYKNNNQFIPAGTPVIIRTSNKDGYVTMALPNLPNPTTPVPCVFSGKYLEQMLVHGSDYVYAFGKSLGTFTLDGNFANNGLLSPHAIVSTNVGFYVNANPNKEVSNSRISWARNNKYVLGNKIYYRANSSGASSRELTRSPEFIPVVFDDDDEEEEDDPIGESLLQRPHDNRVYDLLGRCVATGEEVVNGTWRSKVASGIYILNGRKIYVK